MIPQDDGLSRSDLSWIHHPAASGKHNDSGDENLRLQTIHEIFP